MESLTTKEISIAFIQLLPIILIWVRLENRLATLEGRFNMYMETVGKILLNMEKRH